MELLARGLCQLWRACCRSRSVHKLKQVVTEQKMMPLVESVNVPFFMNYITGQDGFVPDEGIKKSADTMLSELLKWTVALKTMRKK